MGVITPNRFNPIKAFCNVRLQQGVPLVDADVNELDDIRKFEVRAFLKWFVGDGIPDGNDGFRIAPAPAPSADDFAITAGPQLAAAGARPDPTIASPALGEFAVHGCGRCIVDGLDVIISSDLTYKDQPLHRSRPGAAALAAAYGVPVIADVPPPPPTGSIFVYLDIWERPVAPSEDGSLVVPPLGTESCARLKREWAVRTVAGLEFTPPVASTGVPHHYYVLATIRGRVAGGVAQPIVSTDITDRREQRLLMPPSTLIPDVLGTSATEYRQGHNRPAMSLRDALNAVLRGEVPATAEAAVTPDTADELASFAFVFDPAGGTSAVWRSARLGPSQIFAARWTPASAGTGFTGPVAITSPVTTEPSAAILPNGDAIVAYSRLNTTTAKTNVLFKHGSSLGVMTPSSPAEVPVVSDSAVVSQELPFVVSTGSAAGGSAVFFFHETLQGSPARWVYQRRAYTAAWSETAAVWTDATGQALSSGQRARDNPNENDARDFHAAFDGAGNIWAAYRSPTAPPPNPLNLTAIQVTQLNVATNTLTSLPLLNPGKFDQQPFVLADASSTSVWVFWQSEGGATTGIFSQQYQSGTAAAVGTPTLVPDTVVNVHTNPCAVRDTTGTIWLFWEDNRGSGSRIWFNRRRPNGEWGSARQITSSAFADVEPFALLGPDGYVWLFWRRGDSPTATRKLYYKRIFTAI